MEYDLVCWLMCGKVAIQATGCKPCSQVPVPEVTTWDSLVLEYKGQNYNRGNSNNRPAKKQMNLVMSNLFNLLPATNNQCIKI